MTSLENIRQKFHFLFERGFVEIESNAWIVILSHDELLLRITHDRADWFADVGFSFLPDRWYELWDVLSLLSDKGILEKQFRPTNKLAGVKSALKANVDALIRVDEYRENIDLLRAN